MPLREQGFWRLVSHLSLGHLSVVGGAAGAEALREVLRLYDGRDSAETRAAIRALLEVGSAPGTARVSGARPGRVLPRPGRDADLRRGGLGHRRAVPAGLGARPLPGPARHGQLLRADPGRAAGAAGHRRSMAGAGRRAGAAVTDPQPGRPAGGRAAPLHLRRRGAGADAFCAAGPTRRRRRGSAPRRAWPIPRWRWTAVEQDPAGGPPTVTIALFGLTGPSGVLPRHYTDAVVTGLREPFALAARVPGCPVAGDDGVLCRRRNEIPAAPGGGRGVPWPAPADGAGRGRAAGADRLRHAASAGPAAGRRGAAAALCRPVLRPPALRRPVWRRWPRTGCRARWRCSSSSAPGCRLPPSQRTSLAAGLQLGSLQPVGRGCGDRRARLGPAGPHRAADRPAGRGVVPATCCPTARR